ncbi:malto-oligosyltrehalose synthase [Pelagibacterium sp. H642]|uniref:malto-oligosyltrehalose synthase n=1 Tax=Pelagibacterium sp. H642 TaxID=1881069 RepID=UPI0028154EEE|nr:malto-oligosyltrehalose synthase [Pelagibacterium sp. H642]WMT92855.1 malto-oligosyltrehalose synthase [Pelagibacterium sp. H642]
MIAPIPTATYRIQLRGSVDFATVQDQLDYLGELGISHLYLSPIFTATSGSTHGYDVTNPTQIDPALGGKAGFEALAKAAFARNIGIILDIVPNHTAFNFENPWLMDVLRKGRASSYARHFDIDWDAGPIVLPILAEPFEKMLLEDRFAIDGDHWVHDGIKIPLAEGSSRPAQTRNELRTLHAQQHWRLSHWELERDGITHRRFFNVTGLIGMRVEDRSVFDDTHALTIDLVKAGLVHGLRVDHIDGLADPRTYLEWLSEVLPGTPVWVEKIVVGKERLPAEWKTTGTTGYEAARLIARLLTDADGLDRLDRVWRHHTQTNESFATTLDLAKRDILKNELAAELHHLVRLADRALLGSPLAEPGPESLREAIIEMIAAMPRYRTYVAKDSNAAEDHALIELITEAARTKMRSSSTLDAIASLFLDQHNDAAYPFIRRFQQVSGALLAKAQEDTAGFRWTRYIAANEVGAEPDEATVSEDEANAFLAARGPTEMTLTSTHDTKRSEDSRMRLVAISHEPEVFAKLLEGVERLESAGAVEPRWRWYITQSALAIWGSGPADASARLTEHVLKAMREAKQATFWTRPNQETEAAACQFASALCEFWRFEGPCELDVLVARAEALGLAQLALKALLPGFPDFYRGSEGQFLALTDPDNRLPTDFAVLAQLEQDEGYGGEKYRLTRWLLAFRRTERDFLADAKAYLTRCGETLELVREREERRLVLSFGPVAHVASRKALWLGTRGNRELCISWQ